MLTSRLPNLAAADRFEVGAQRVDVPAWHEGRVRFERRPCLLDELAERQRRRRLDLLFETRLVSGRAQAVGDPLQRARVERQAD
jgi:hypothetical protein